MEALHGVRTLCLELLTLRLFRIDGRRQYLTDFNKAQRASVHNAVHDAEAWTGRVPRGRA